MKRLTCSLVLLIVLISLVTVSTAQTPKNIEGNWLGTVDFGGLKLRLAFKVGRNNEKDIAKFDSIDQGAKDLEVDSVIQEGDDVKFLATKLGLTYEGKLNETGDELVGTLKQGAGAFPLVLKRVS